jgi:hypothetical protein
MRRITAVFQTTHNRQNTHKWESSLPPRKRSAKQADASAQIRRVARAWPWPVVGNRAGATRMAGSEQTRAGKPWHTTGQGPRTHVSESPGNPKLGRANNLQNSTQNTHIVRAGTPLGTPSRTDRFEGQRFVCLAIAVVTLTSQEESASDVFWCASSRRFISFPILPYGNA